MIDWFRDSFTEDPAGWTAVLLAITAGLLSAVFWRRTWAVIRFFGRALRSIVRFLVSLRITTAERVQRKKDILVPVRWAIRPAKLPGQFALGNMSEGSIATDVIVHSLSDEAIIMDRAMWAEIPGGMAGTFKMDSRLGAFYFGVTFQILWTDARGRRQSDTFRLQSD